VKKKDREINTIKTI